jgi:hypothetical protein
VPYSEDTRQILNFAFVCEPWLSFDAGGRAVLDLLDADITGSDLTRGVHVLTRWLAMVVAVA